MSVSIDNVFVKQFEADVHLAYQQMGTKLRSTVRSKSGVVGASTTFQKVGRGTASTKSRHGIVPVMNLNHEPVECVLQDYYAGDWVDALDELKVNIDERRVVASAGAYALGRKTDELIIAAMNSATQSVGDYASDFDELINNRRRFSNSLPASPNIGKYVSYSVMSACISARLRSSIGCEIISLALFHSWYARYVFATPDHFCANSG